MKKIIFVVGAVLLLTGCGNHDMWDTNYTYDYALCNFEGIPEKIEIKQWATYDGEQIQIIAKDENIYLVSSIYCTLVREK